MLSSLVLVALLPIVLGHPTSGFSFLAKRQSAGPSCPAGGVQSCPSQTGVNSCCTNSPGGYFLQTQFWDANPATGPSDSWTLHGLWPDNCDGSFSSNCDLNRAYTNITAILQSGGAQATLDYMNAYWLDQYGANEQFWSHEWSKHGTCISTLVPSCYGSSYVPQEEVVQFFQRTVALFRALPSYSWLTSAGIVPSTSATYTLAQLQAVANANFGHDVVWQCSSGELNEVWFGFTTSGTVTSGTFTPAGPVSTSSCPATGIKWLPKSSASTTTASSPTTTAPATTSTGSGTAPTGKVFMNVVSNGATNGCLISTGKWLVGATCAGYTVTNSGSSFTLATSKGPCQISSSTFVCGSGLSPTSFTVDSNNDLVYAASSTFYASAVPSGSTQVTVLTTAAAQSLKIHYGA